MRIPAFLCILLAAPAALAARLELPLRVPIAAVEQALAQQVSSVVYREGRCRYLNLDAPKLEAQDQHLRFVGPGAGALGVELGAKCANAAAWKGSMQFTLEPRIDEAGRLRVRVIDSQLTDAGGIGFIWELSKRHMHPRLERFSYDLGAAREPLLALLRNVAPSEHTAAMEQVVASLQLLQPRVEKAHVVVPLALEIPDAWLIAPVVQASTAPLTEDEAEALEKAIEPWDAFVVFVIRQVARDNPALRQRLFTLLLDSRYKVVAMLAGETPAGGDPLRTLFLDTWNELREILADARYSLFLEAGDAMIALEQAAPGLAMRPSADALRQMARSLKPGEAGDPLAFGWEVDEDLRQMFDVEDSAPPPVPTRTSSLGYFLRTSNTDAPALDRWVPARDEFAAYQSRVGELLIETSAAELKRTALPAPHDKVYRYMVPTTALIESCWRQYVRRGGKVTFLKSQSNSVGIMQINQLVWRGFYDVKRLRWDTAYNIHAGSQILMRYMKDYAIPYAAKTGDPNHVPRAAYAVYNAGPKAVGRFNRNPPHPREARVDGKLWDIYQGIVSGGQADLASCGVKHLKN